MIRYLTAAEIAEIYRRPLGTIYRLAHIHRWRRSTDKRRPVLYHVEDVESTMRRKPMRSVA